MGETDLIVRDTNGNTIAKVPLAVALFGVLDVTKAEVSGSGNIIVTVALLSEEDRR